MSAFLRKVAHLTYIKHLLPLLALVTAHDTEQISDKISRKIKPSGPLKRSFVIRQSHDSVCSSNSWVPS